jgi:hypothetical protein
MSVVCFRRGSGREWIVRILSCGTTWHITCMSSDHIVTLKTFIFGFLDEILYGDLSIKDVFTYTKTKPINWKEKALFLLLVWSLIKTENSDIFNLLHIHKTTPIILQKMTLLLYWCNYLSNDNLATAKNSTEGIGTRNYIGDENHCGVSPIFFSCRKQTFK